MDYFLKAPLLESFYSKFTGLLVCNVTKKNDPRRDFCCESSEKSRDSFSTEHLQIAASGFQFIVTAWKVSIFGVILVCTQSECGEIHTRITPNTGTSYAVCRFTKQVLSDIEEALKKKVDWFPLWEIVWKV